MQAATLLTHTNPAHTGTRRRHTNENTPLRAPQVP